MAVDEIHLGKGGKAPADFLQILLRSPIAAHLARQATLPTHPLAINIIIALKPRAIALYARLRFKNDSRYGH